mgnify:CR=1 FL=1|jgi:hypothetical protein
MFKLIFFVPVEEVEKVKTAIFAAGAGKQGDYDCCAWQTLGTGQFRPLEGSKPFIGELDKLERVEEYRVETLVEETRIYDVLQALKQAHPYEEPAYDVLRLENF